MATIVIDGQNFEGKNVSIINGRVIIDGKEYASITVVVNGNLNSLDCASAQINGDVLGDVDCTSLNCKAIGGNVDVTNVNCDYIEGDVDATVVKTKK